MENYILDTNAFYNYLIINQNICLEKIVSNKFIDIQKFNYIFNGENAVYISPITVCETIARFQNYPNIIRTIFQSCVGKIKIVCKPQGFNIDKNDISALATVGTSDKVINEIITKYIEIKINYESEYISYLFMIDLIGISRYFIADPSAIEKLIDLEPEKYSNYLFFPVELFVESQKIVVEKTKTFYKDLKAKKYLIEDEIKKYFDEKLKIESKSLIEELVIIIAKKLKEKNYNTNVNDIFKSQIMEYISNDNKSITILLADFFNKTDYCNQKTSDVLINSAINFLCGKNHNKLYKNYLQLLFNKWIVKGAKLNKNDFFDCVYFIFVENGIIPVCFEKKMTKFLSTNNVPNIGLDNVRKQANEQ